MFTKQHFTSIANIFKEEQEKIPFLPEETKKHVVLELEIVVMKFCEMFGECNPEFDWYIFITACGMDANKLLEGE